MGNKTSSEPSTSNVVKRRSYYDNKSDHSGPTKNEEEESEDSISFKILQDRGCQTTESTIRQLKKIDHWPLRITRKMVILSFLFYLATGLLFAYSETMQSLLVYLHFARWPLGDLRDHRHVNLSNAKNIDLITQDNLLLRGYHIYPPQDYPSSPTTLQSAERIVIYFHGNAGTRAVRNRIEITRKIASSLNAHVIAFDYRGFGDSDGWPSEAGTHLDAWAALRWVEANISPRQTKPPIFLYGHSLGSGVATALAEDLSQQNDTRVTGLILDAPFTSLREAAMTHPSAVVFRIFPIIQDFLAKRLKIIYPSYERVGRLRIPVLLMHGDEDWEIPFHHSQRLLRRAVNSGSFFETDFTKICPLETLTSLSEHQDADTIADESEIADENCVPPDGGKALEGDLQTELGDQLQNESPKAVSSLPIQLRIFSGAGHDHIHQSIGWSDLIRSFVICAGKR
eukprot:gene3993-4368_t